MELKLITKTNKVLNAISIVTLTFGVLSILWTMAFGSELLAGILVGLVCFGILTLLLNWFLKSKIKLGLEDIAKLRINTLGTLDEIKEEKDVEYLGNWIYLTNGNHFEIDRCEIIELFQKLDEDKIEIKISKQKFYNISPKELIKFLLELGP